MIRHDPFDYRFHRGESFLSRGNYLIWWQIEAMLSSVSQFVAVRKFYPGHALRKVFSAASS